MRICLLIVSVFLFGYAEPAGAQRGGATQIELTASYCVGALNQELRRVQMNPGSIVFLEAKAQRDRYIGYLLSTGALDPSVSFAATVGLFTALRRGEAEMATCNNSMRSCMERNACQFPLAVCNRPDVCSNPGRILPFPFGQ